MTALTDAQELDLIAEQEARLQFAAFSNEDAIDLGLDILTRARAERMTIAIDIRRFGHRLFHAALTGSSPDNAGWIERKIRVTEHFGHSSLFMGATSRAQNIDYAKVFGLSPATHAFSGGCFPILIRDTGPIGTITVSGLPQRDDHALVVWAIERAQERQRKR